MSKFKSSLKAESSKSNSLLSNTCRKRKGRDSSSSASLPRAASVHWRPKRPGSHVPKHTPSRAGKNTQPQSWKERPSAPKKGVKARKKRALRSDDQRARPLLGAGSTASVLADLEEKYGAPPDPHWDILSVSDTSSTFPPPPPISAPPPPPPVEPTPYEVPDFIDPNKAETTIQWTPLWQLTGYEIPIFALILRHARANGVRVQPPADTGGRLAAILRRQAGTDIVHDFPEACKRATVCHIHKIIALVSMFQKFVKDRGPAQLYNWTYEDRAAYVVRHATEDCPVNGGPVVLSEDHELERHCEQRIGEDFLITEAAHPQHLFVTQRDWSWGIESSDRPHRIQIEVYRGSYSPPICRGHVFKSHLEECAHLPTSDWNAALSIWRQSTHTEATIKHITRVYGQTLTAIQLRVLCANLYKYRDNALAPLHRESTMHWWEQKCVMSGADPEDTEAVAIHIRNRDQVLWGAAEQEAKRSIIFILTIAILGWSYYFFYSSLPYELHPPHFAGNVKSMYFELIRRCPIHITPVEASRFATWAFILLPIALILHPYHVICSFYYNHRQAQIRRRMKLLRIFDSEK